MQPDSAISPLHQRRYLVGGELRSWAGPVEQVLSPVLGSDGKPTPIGSYPAQGAAESEAALAAACAAWDLGRGRWPTMPVAGRIACVEAFLARMQAVREPVVRLLMWEIGKTRGDSEKEFDRTVVYVRDTLAALKELDRVGARFQSAEGVVAQVRRSPLGVTLCMGPFNYPLNETFTTLIPALVMGNPVIFKPPKLGILLHEPLLDAFAASFPPGVVNTVYGDGRAIITPLMRSGRVDVLAFIGSSRVADLIRAQHPKPHRLRCVLGLEAKNPAIVTARADLDLAVRECLLGSLSFNGQRCTALKLLWVEQGVHGAFLERFAAAVDGLRHGLPWEPGVQLTPLPEPGKPAAMQALVDDARAKGAAVANRRAGPIDATSFFPAVLSPAAPGTRIWAEEQFGPVVPVASFADAAEPLSWLAASDYGQQAAVFSQDPAEVALLADGLVNLVCRVNVNSQCQRGPDVYPFTGRKDSAEGTLSVTDALRVFSIRSMVAARDLPANHRILGDIARERRSAFISTDWLF
jgi:glyceraldehyde-3-phosphate dehydrogenase (NADP+)